MNKIADIIIKRRRKQVFKDLFFLFLGIVI